MRPQLTAPKAAHHAASHHPGRSPRRSTHKQVLLASTLPHQPNIKGGQNRSPESSSQTRAAGASALPPAAPARPSCGGLCGWTSSQKLEAPEAAAGPWRVRPYGPWVRTARSTICRRVSSASALQFFLLRGGGWNEQQLLMPERAAPYA